MTEGDSSPDELADAISAVQVIENDRFENMAILGTRLCSGVASTGAGGAGNFNYWQLHNPFASADTGQSVIMTVLGFGLHLVTGQTAGNSGQVIVDMNFADATPLIGAKNADGNFLDTRLALSGGNQPLPRGQIWLQQAANIGGGAWRPLYRVPVATVNATQPWEFCGWPNVLMPSAQKIPLAVLAPNTTLLLNTIGSDFTNIVSQVSFWWTERLMTEREGTFQQDTRHWTL